MSLFLALILLITVAGCGSTSGSRRHTLPKRNNDRAADTQAAPAAPAATAPVDANTRAADATVPTARGADATPVAASSAPARTTVPTAPPVPPITPQLPSSPSPAAPNQPTETAPPAPPAEPPAPTPTARVPQAEEKPSMSDRPDISSIPAGESRRTKLRTLYQQAAERYAALPGYTAQLHRREQINGKDKPEELILVKFREQPFSVFFKWLGPQAQGREVVFVKGQHGSLIHTLLAQGDMPLMPAGRHMQLPPDNYFVRASSRHAITEAGIGMMIQQFGQLVASNEKGDNRSGTLHYRGRVQRPEFPQPLEAVEQDVAAGSEAAMPRGGKRQWFFDTGCHLPLLVITHDHTDHEVEYYCYQDLREATAFSDDDFNPDKLWKKN